METLARQTVFDRGSKRATSWTLPACKNRYSPFFNKARDEFQFIEETYDYTSRELETAKWYTAVVDSGEARWSDPYFGKAAETMVVDYGVPLVDDEGRTIGIVDYAISLADRKNKRPLCTSGKST